VFCLQIIQQQSEIAAETDTANNRMSSSATATNMMRWTTVTMLLQATTAASNNEKWMQPIRRLQANDFMTSCQRIFMSPGRMQRNEYLASQFVTEVGELCESFNMASECPEHTFTSLPKPLQNGFFNQACLHMGLGADCPVESLSMMGDTGYLYTPRTAVEIDAMRTDLCVQIGNVFGTY
jgi:hypothetical protein